MSDRIFSKEEVQKLIKRAAELETEQSVSGKGSGENGLTISEVKHIASEAGLNPQLIEQAASEMDENPSDLKDKVRVNSDEIASEEIWLDHQPDGGKMDELVTELNHLYGTTGELKWRENLFGIQEGKEAEVKRSTNSMEWISKTANGMYSTRVLMQKQSGRFRIRVSKQLLVYDLDWEGSGSFLIVVIVAFFLGAFGGIGSLKLFGTFWPGLMIGITLSFLSHPLTQYVVKRTTEKHKHEVANTVRQLSNLALQSSNQKKNKPKTSKKARSASEIEIPDEPESSESQPGKLRNSLRN